MPKIAVLIPAHNEESSIARAVESALHQLRKPDLVVVLANGCTDNTVTVAKHYHVIVEDLPRLKYRKAEALNFGWKTYCQDVDLVVCLDADTALAPNALADWVTEFEDDQLAGSSTKFTMKEVRGFLARMQRAEYAAWIDLSLRRRTTAVLSGTGAAYRNSVLRMLAVREDREGPWAYTSQVEDFEITYRMQGLGYRTHISPTIRAYTDAMSTLRDFWRQRMKWQVGTLEDLMHFGFNRRTRRLWALQVLNLAGIVLTVLWISVLTLAISLETFLWSWWWLILPVLVSALHVKQALRIPHRDKRDLLLALAWLPHEVFVLLKQLVTLAGWREVLWSKLTKNRKDRWAIQYGR